MRIQRLDGPAALAALAILLAACSTGGGATPTPAGNGGGGGGSSAAAGSQGSGGGGGSAGGLDACSFLTADQIQAAVGWPVSPGVKQNTDSQTDCEWGSNDGESSVGLTISDYDDYLFQAGASAGISKPVSGVGEAAFKGWPHAGDLTIKIKGYQVAVAIIDFKATNDKLDAEDLTLAGLVLPKL